LPLLVDYCLCPPAITVAAIFFAATAAAVVAIIATAIAVNIAANAALLSLHWHSCCATLLSFYRTSWLLPVALPL
jgi:hypothetical protein